MFGGGVESLEACRALFEPYVCRGAEQILPQYRAQDSSWTPFSSLPVVLVYNPKLLSAGQLSCWADLLDPALRGQIAFADPSVSGSSYTALVTMLCALGGRRRRRTSRRPVVRPAPFAAAQAVRLCRPVRPRPRFRCAIQIP